MLVCFLSGPDATLIREQGGEDVARVVFKNLPETSPAWESARILIRYHWIPNPYPQCVVHVLKGPACCARVTPASSPASLQAELSAHVACAPCLPVRLLQSFLRTLRSQKHNIYLYILMGTKLKYSAVLHLFGRFPRVSEGLRSPRACVHTHAHQRTCAIAHESTLRRLK
jgi:hypothetical protein